nr:NADH dehydrogenase subunit 4 [Aspidomorpha difformis]
MMKFIFYILFLMPLSFLNFNFVYFHLFILFLIFMFNINSLMNFSNLSLILGCDGLSYYLILLSFWISSLMLLASWKIYYSKTYCSIFIFTILLLLLCLFMCFCSLNLFVFYIFFEISLIPLLFLIIGWGYQPERLLAGMYLIFYTLFFSFPMMIGLFMLMNKFNSLMFFEFKIFNSYMIYFLLNMVFFVKIPMFFLHLWLPKAHVEAPISGSMILAGLVLKLGGYGLIRLMKMFLFIGLKLNMIFMILSLLGGMIVSFICLFQTDIKLLIAYSSVSHMSMILSGILSMNLSGLVGSVVLMVAHGLCSSGLFCLANIYYERLMSRSMYMLKGMMNIFPSFSLFMFLLSASNMAAPPSLNLMGEILLLKSLISYNWIFMIFFMLLLFFSAVYSMYMYSYSNHGNYYSGLYSFCSGFVREFLLLFLHWFPLNCFILLSDSMMFN